MTEEERQRAIQAWLKSRQGSNLFSTTPMGQNQKIDVNEYNSLKDGNSIAYNVDKQSGTMFGSVNPHGMGVTPKYESTNVGVNPGAAYNSPGAPINFQKPAPAFLSTNSNVPLDNQVVPQVTQTGLVPTRTTSALNTIQPTNAVSDAPKRNLDFNKYSKSMDKTFMMAALQSAIPQNDETPARQAPSSGGRGGGNRMDQLTPYASAIKLDDENYPSLWRYS